MADYYLIGSKLNGYVLDIKGGSTAPVTPIISYPKNGESGTANQLWERAPTGPKDSAGGQSQYLIKSKLNGFVLDITGSNKAPGTQVISYPKNGANGTPNQIWEIVFAGEPDYFLITSKLNGYVLDIKGGSTAPVTSIISYPKNGANGTPNQLWKFVRQDNNGKKKSAFAGG